MLFAYDYVTHISSEVLEFSLSKPISYGYSENSYQNN